MKNVLICGPKGSGKSLLMAQLAKIKVNIGDPEALEPTCFFNQIEVTLNSQKIQFIEMGEGLSEDQTFDSIIDFVEKMKFNLVIICSGVYTAYDDQPEVNFYSKFIS